MENVKFKMLTIYNDANLEPSINGFIKDKFIIDLKVQYMAGPHQTHQVYITYKEVN